jgi:hypothetical protein
MGNCGDIADGCRAALKEYDDGLISGATLDHDLFMVIMKDWTAVIKTGTPWMTFSSCCCRSHPPDEKYLCEITIQPHGVRILRHRSFLRKIWDRLNGRKPSWIETI